jgi:hypothetical protein
MNKPLQSACYFLIALSMAVTTTGCTSTSCSSWSPKNWFANRPRPFQNCFRGAPCNTCNPPLGKLQNYDSNLMGRCDDGSCGGNMNSGQQPVYQGAPSGAVPYYPSEMQPPMETPGTPMLNAPGPDMSMAPIQTNYPPRNDVYSDSQFGSGISNTLPGFETNAEAITPPMYGNRNKFN